MSLPRFVIDEVVVLKRINYGEADRLVTVLSKNYGRFTALAKGVRKLNSKKAAHLEPFTHARLYVLGSYSLPLITQAQTISSFATLRENLVDAAMAFRIVELVEKLTLEGDGYSNVFDELVVALDEIEKGQGASGIKEFQNMLLSSLGYGSTKNFDDQQLEVFLEKVLERKLSSSRLI